MYAHFKIPKEYQGPCSGKDQENVEGPVYNSYYQWVPIFLMFTGNFFSEGVFLYTLTCLIDIQVLINVRGGNFGKNNKRTGPNKFTGWKYCRKSNKSAGPKFIICGNYPYLI